MFNLGDMMIGDEGTGGTHLYCRRFAVGWCFEHANGRCRGWQAMKPSRWGCDGNLISLCVIRHARLKHIVLTERSCSQLHLLQRFQCLGLIPCMTCNIEARHGDCTRKDDR